MGDTGTYGHHASVEPELYQTNEETYPGYTQYREQHAVTYAGKSAASCGDTLLGEGPLCH